MDYGRHLEFGISVVPATEALPEVRALVRAADDAGLDLVGIQDHPYQRRFVDTWALIGTLLADTSRVRVFPDVACLPLRPPAMMAKQAATLDVLSNGRFELGLGAGAFWDAIVAMGGPRRTPGDAVESLEEAIAIIRQAWSDTRSVSVDGDHYQVHGYHPGPRPAHAIEVWVGAYRPRMLRTIGRVADGWLPSLGRIPLDELASMQGVIDASARAVGRDPAAIRRMLNLSGSVGRPAGTAEGMTGTADAWVETLVEWATGIGVDTFILWPSLPERSQVKTWATEVVPRVRAEVDRRRSGGGAG